MKTVSLRVACFIGVELRLWVATCVTGLSAFCQLSLAVERPIALLVLFFSSLALYNLDGTLDASDDDSTSRRRAHLLVTSLSAMAALFAATRLSTDALRFTLLGLALTSLYAIPWDCGPTPRRLKAIPFLKAPFVGGAVAVAAVFVPLLAEGGFATLSTPLGMQGLCLSAPLALLCTVNAALFDFPDRNADSLQSVPTPILVLGIRQTRRLLVALVALSIALTGALDFNPQTTFAIGSLAGGLIIATLLVHDETTKQQIAWCVDGLLLAPLLVHVVLNSIAVQPSLPGHG